ncbi:TIGR01777 family oxidoreductase [Salinicoccus carnicancri]|uniref:TIGR01777 family oxidoreductase n=1 Tax=Salinicoccus carnicancri TaxID=558170 RepID=UPI0003068915|nr:TIGR01777 family oxidoreductase [Salinicoccus carnicancri]
MNVLITGGTGFIGGKLIEILKEEHDHVYILSRGNHTSEHPYLHYIKYNPDDDTWMADMPKHIDIIYNFAGASLQHRWTDAHKQEILDSRIDVTRMLNRWVEQAETTPDVLVNASAIGYYPVSESARFDEEDAFAPHDFLSSVVTAWEREAQKCSKHGVRVVLARFGLILDSEQGALPKMAMPYRLGAGGTLGSGNQWYSWIHVDDLLNALLFAGVNKDIEGPVNMTAPTPHRQKQFSVYLAAALGRPSFVKVPGFLIEKVLGEQSMLILKGQYVKPEVLMEHDFKFIFPTLEIALEDLFEEGAAAKA